MNRLEYFKARLEANISPMEYVRAVKEQPEKYLLVDVRVASPHIKRDKIQKSIEIPLNELKQRFSELPKDKQVIVYCWDVWCTLASKAAVTLLENGYDVKELYGGIEAWKTLNLPTTSVFESNIDCEC